MTVKVIFDDDSERVFADCTETTLNLIDELFNVKSITIM